MLAVIGATMLAASAGATNNQVDRQSYYDAHLWANKYIGLRKPEYDAALRRLENGRLLSHLSYGEWVSAPIELLVSLDATYRTKQCDLLKTPAEAAEAMMRAANAKLARVATLRAQSCFRSEAEQVGIFCNGERRRPSANCENPAVRALVSAPPGFSEHATGYTIDFVACGPKPKDPCGGLDQRFAASKPGIWMIDHATEYGFELSFPCPDPSHLPCATKTVQGVSYEPWHWRWVGRKGDVSPEAQHARHLFATARRCFPASPGIDTVAPPTSIPDCLKAPFDQPK